MKVSKLFHWLYASVMFIPLMIAPIFGLAVRSDNNFQPIEVQTAKYEVVDFNQLSKNVITQYTDQYGWYGSQTELVLNDGIFEATPTSNADFPGIVSPMIKSTANHVYVISCYFKGANALHLNFGGYDAPIGSNLNPSDFNYVDYRLQTTETSNYGIALFVPTGLYPNLSIEFYNKINVFDLTQMFGSGNEPTLSQFRSYYGDDYYEFTLSHKELLYVGDVTLNDADVGSQMVYTLYNATDKYFNFNQFLGIGNLFDWFQLNVFNGNAPLGFYIFWNLLIYWLLVSLAWLIFDIAMFVPKLAHRWLDKASLE